MQVVNFLGFASKVKEGTLTADEQKQIFAEYEKQFNTTFEADKTANEDAEEEAKDVILSAEELKQIADILEVDEKEISQKPKEAVKQVAEKVAETKKVVEKLSNEPDKPTPEKVVVTAPNFSIARAHSATHLFGVENELFSLANGENRVMVDKKPFLSEISSSKNQKERKAFLTRLENYSEKVAERIDYLDKNSLLGALDFQKQAAGLSGTIDYSQLFDIAGEYIVRRTDLILAYLRSLPSVRNIFPMVSGVQNKMIAPTANFAELSQGYRKGRIFKGSVHFGAELYKVDDVMFKYDFEDLIELERQYIGYLNREGSSVFKWTLIEWIMVHFGEKLQNEQNVRNVRGVAVPEQNVNSNPAVFAADGALRAIQRAVKEFKVKPFENIGIYDADTMLDVVEQFYDKVNEVSPDMSQFKLYLNARHKRWYIRAFRQKYGQDADFTGARNPELIDMDPSVIIWVPNMLLNDFTIWASIPGNVELLEDRPNEMLMFYFTQEFENVLAFSRWKEGSHVRQPGIQFKNKAELDKNNFQEQWLFVNKPTTALTLAATIDLSANSHFIISGTTAVTEVSDFATDVVYKLEAAAAGVKVVKSGVFAKISDDFIAVAPGDYIEVYPELEDYTLTIDGFSVLRSRPTGNFLELERQVSVAPPTEE